MTNKNSDWSEGLQPLTVKDIESLTINDNSQLDLFVDNTMNSSFDYSPSTSVDLNDVFVNLNSSVSNFDTTYSLAGVAQPTLTIGDLGGIFTNPLTTDSNSVSVNGNLNVTDGHINLDGKSLSERLAKIEERIGVLISNPNLELEYDKLKRLGNKYRKLEKQLEEKSKTWNILKRDDNNE